MPAASGVSAARRLRRKSPSRFVDAIHVHEYAAPGRRWADPAVASQAGVWLDRRRCRTIGPIADRKADRVHVETRAAPGSDRRRQPAPRPRRAADRELHARRRLLDPQRRAARGRRRRRLLARAPAVDRHRVRALRGRLHAAVRPDRRPVRPPPAVPRPASRCSASPRSPAASRQVPPSCSRPASRKGWRRRSSRPAALSLLTTAFPEGPLRERALGLNGALMAAGFTTGAILGGVLTDVLSWRWAFFINVAVAAAVLAVAPAVLRESRPERAAAARRARRARGHRGAAGPRLRADPGGERSWTAPATLGRWPPAPCCCSRSSRSSGARPSRSSRSRSCAARTVAVGQPSPACSPSRPRPRSSSCSRSTCRRCSATRRCTPGLSFAVLGAGTVLGGIAGPRVIGALGGRARDRRRLRRAGGGDRARWSLLGPDQAGSSLLLVATFAGGIANLVAIVGFMVTATSGLPDAEQGLATGLASMSQQVGITLGIPVMSAIVAARVGALGGDGDVLSGVTLAIAVNAAACLATAALVALVIRGDPARELGEREDRDRRRRRLRARRRPRCTSAPRRHGVRGERVRRAGTRTPSASTPSDETHHVDTGFIVFNDRNYPNFERLLDRLGVAVAAVGHELLRSPTARRLRVRQRVAERAVRAAARTSSAPWFHRMLADLVRFNRAARALAGAPGDDRLARRTGCERQRFSPAFVERLIVPQASAVWSADPHQMWSFPARFLAEFFDNHGMLGFRGRPQWRDGRRRLGALRRRAHARPCARPLRLSTPVARDRAPCGRRDRHARRRRAERFDEVVLATHSDQALALLADAGDREHELLGAIPYQPNEAVLHTDARLLPRRRRAWASWNYHLLEDRPRKPTVTYHMNRLQSLAADREFCVTLNHTDAIDPAKVIRTIDYAHPVFTAQGDRRPAAPRRDQRPQPHPLLRRLLGLGLPRGRRRSARMRVGGAPARDRERDLRGHDPPPPLRRCAGTSSGTRSRWPTSTSTSCPDCSAGGWSGAGPAWCASAAPTTSAIPRVPLADAVRELVEQRTGTAPDGPVRLLTHPRTLGHCFNPVSFYYCFGADGDARGGRRRGHEHAVGRAPRLRARPHRR